MDGKLLLGQPKGPLVVRSAVEEAIDKSKGRAHIRSGFAYATQAGADALLGSLSSEGWKRANKRWILGIHHGITEPFVVRVLRKLSNSKVRLFTGGDSLRTTTLTKGPRFHAKLIRIDDRDSSEVQLLAAMSANLTGAAMGVAARNYEAGVQLDSLIETDRKQFDAWWAAAWRQSIDATDANVAKYAALRDGFLTRNPDASTQLDPPSPDRLGEGDWLWIDAGAMSGGSRNQVEFGTELAPFFGVPQKATRQLRIKIRGREWADRPLSYKQTTFGVDIWRLGLPTKAQGAPFSYAGNVICFRRRSDDGNVWFEVDVTARGTRRQRRWFLAANRDGYLGVTSGNREFGFW